MPDFINQNCQTIYLSTIPQYDLIRRVGRIPYNLNAPTALTDIQKSEVKNNPEATPALPKTRKDFKKCQTADGGAETRVSIESMEEK